MKPILFFLWLKRHVATNRSSTQESQWRGLFLPAASERTRSHATHIFGLAFAHSRCGSASFAHRSSGGACDRLSAEQVTEALYEQQVARAEACEPAAHQQDAHVDTVDSHAVPDAAAFGPSLLAQTTCRRRGCLRRFITECGMGC